MTPIRRQNTTPRSRTTANDLKLALGRATRAAAATVAKPPRRAPGGSQEAQNEPVVLTAKTLRLVEDIKAPFMAFGEGHQLLEKGRAQLAPKFMKACMAWQGETGGTFVAFVQLLDPTVPTDKDGYKAHSSYAAADYLRRLMGNAAAARATSTAEKPATPVQVIATLLATMSPIVDNMDAIWTAFETRLRWSPQRIRHLQTLVGQSPTPLLAKKPGGQKLTAAA